MFAVKILVIIIVLQTLHNSQCLPFGVLGNAGTYFGIMNGLMSLASKQLKNTEYSGQPNQRDSVLFPEVLNFDNTVTDKPMPSPANCSIGCAKKTFKELIFINKLFQSVNNLYGNINERLDEISLMTGKTTRSAPRKNSRKGRTQFKPRVKRSQENIDPVDSTTKSKFYPEYGVAYHRFASLYPGLRRTFLHIKIEIPSSPPYVHLQPLNRSDCIDMYEKLKLLSNMANEKGYIAMCEESFDT